ncbi:hypothetical protein BU24DRAFT_491626 [Aaosphaeria arxii CBS 175.79]|uniref:Uncharacterized protein n=1 Tax=Aaosphaeria arxii CBS 175.79 TaxID=1450172 RepID=A0A6A5XQ25_9PLEO|nr:uncharacterized protein BU24DRAFT_491626 [Aaosphaeria arxii CBS 175.79]KAF2015375.1 hypothetical protein BU24DRAFT_491626 [Aaosphaeria arxii CBS 175.79]
MGQNYSTYPYHHNHHPAPLIPLPGPRSTVFVPATSPFSFAPPFASPFSPAFVPGVRAKKVKTHLHLHDHNHNHAHLHNHSRRSRRRRYYPRYYYGGPGGGGGWSAPGFDTPGRYYHPHPHIPPPPPPSPFLSPGDCGPFPDPGGLEECFSPPLPAASVLGCAGGAVDEDGDCGGSEFDDPGPGFVFGPARSRARFPGPCAVGGIGGRRYPRRSAYYYPPRGHGGFGSRRRVGRYGYGRGAGAGTTFDWNYPFRGGGATARSRARARYQRGGGAPTTASAGFRGSSVGSEGSDFEGGGEDMRRGFDSRMGGGKRMGGLGGLGSPGVGEGVSRYGGSPVVRPHIGVAPGYPPQHHHAGAGMAYTPQVAPGMVTYSVPGGGAAYQPGGGYQTMDPNMMPAMHQQPQPQQQQPYQPIIVPPQPPVERPATAPQHASASMAHIPAGAYAAGVPTTPSPHPRPQTTEPVPASPQVPKRMFRQSEETGRKGSNDTEGQEWIQGHPFLDACICTTNCTCRKGHRVLYREENGEGGRASGEIRYVLKEQLGKDCGDHSKCRERKKDGTGERRRSRESGGSGSVRSSSRGSSSETTSSLRLGREMYKAARKEAQDERRNRRVEEGLKGILERLEKMELKSSSGSPAATRATPLGGKAVPNAGLGNGIGETIQQPLGRMASPLAGPTTGMGNLYNGLGNPYAGVDHGMGAQMDPRQMGGTTAAAGIGPQMMFGPSPGVRRPMMMPSQMDPRLAMQMNGMSPDFDHQAGNGMGGLDMDMIDPSMAMDMRTPGGMPMRGGMAGGQRGPIPMPRPEMYNGGHVMQFGRRGGRGMPHGMMGRQFGGVHGQLNPGMGRGGRLQQPYRWGPGDDSVAPEGRRRRPEFPLDDEDDTFMTNGHGGRGTGHAEGNESEWEDTGLDDINDGDGDWQPNRGNSSNAGRGNRQGMNRQRGSRGGGRGQGRQAHIEDPEEE